MNNPKRFITKVVFVLSFSVIGALLMAGLDDGTRWIKFVGYLIFFASIISPSVLFPTSSCSIMSRLRRRS